MRIDMGGPRGLDMEAERMPAFEPAGTHPFAAQDHARSGRRRRGLDALAGSLLAAAAVAVLVNVFAFQNGNRPNLMFGFALPGGVGGRISMAPPDPPAPMPASVAAPAPRVAASPAATAPAPAQAQAGPPQSISALLNGTAPVPAAPRSPQPLVADVQRELSRRGLYDGPADGRTGPKTEAAIRAFEQSAHLRPTGEASDALLAQLRRAPTNAALLPPANVGGGADVTGAVRPPAEVPVSPRVLSVQKTLSKLGYGPLKITGRPSAETRQAVQRFERDRNLPVDGEISDRLVRELGAVSGTAIE